MAEDSPYALKKILLMGLRNSGKTSIHRVVFDGIDPQETQHQETTTRPTKVDAISNGFVKFQVWDFPGQTNWIDAGPAFSFAQFLEGCGAIVFVLDASPEADIQEAHDRIVDTITAAHTIDSAIHFEVFIHKADKLTLDAQEETERRLNTSIREKVQLQAEHQAARVRLTFHTTSIYDHTVFKGFSLVVQKIVPQLPYLRSIIDMLTSNSRLQQAMLFDTTSRIFIVADNSIPPKDSTTYELFVEALQLSTQLTQVMKSEGDDNQDMPDNSVLGGDGMSLTAEPVPSLLMNVGDNRTLYVKEFSKTLALVVCGDESAFMNKSLVDYNIGLFSQAVVELFSL